MGKTRCKGCCFARFYGRSRYKKMAFSGAGELIPDKQGRVLIPSDLREFAGLTKDVVVIGLDDKAEIWDKELWDNQQSNMDMEKMLAAMQQLGI